MSSLFTLNSILFTLRILTADNITDCNFIQNRVSSQDACYCDDAECIFEFTLNEGDTLQSVTWITCDHRDIKESSPSEFTQCVVSCTAPNSCDNFVIETFDSDEIIVECDSLSSCNLLELHINDHSNYSIDGNGSVIESNHSIADVYCHGVESCDNLQIHCADDTECNLQCQPITCSVRKYMLSVH